MAQEKAPRGTNTVYKALISQMDQIPPKSRAIVAQAVSQLWTQYLIDNAASWSAGKTATAGTAKADAPAKQKRQAKKAGAATGARRGRPRKDRSSLNGHTQPAAEQASSAA